MNIHPENNRKETRTIRIIADSSAKPIIARKERTQKLLARTDEWEEHVVAHLSDSAQRRVVDEAARLDSLHVDTVIRAVISADISSAGIGSGIGSGISPVVDILLRQIRIKQAGYRCQDTHKDLFDPSRFVDARYILELLQAANNTCFYCREPVLLFYEYRRDPKQWTLERIDNAFGHNRGNVEIACLSCNVRRRTMYHERYIATKQCVLRKLDHA